MNCDGCDIKYLTTFNPLPLKILGDQTVIECPVCNLVMELRYNKRQQRWESLKEYEERRRGWKKSKHKVNPTLTDIAASYTTSSISVDKKNLSDEALTNEYLLR